MKEQLSLRGTSRFAEAEACLEDKEIVIHLTGAAGAEYALVAKFPGGEKILDIFAPQQYDFSKNICVNAPVAGVFDTLQVIDIETEEIMADFLRVHTHHDEQPLDDASQEVEKDRAEGEQSATAQEGTGTAVAESECDEIESAPCEAAQQISSMAAADVQEALSCSDMQGDVQNEKETCPDFISDTADEYIEEEIKELVENFSALHEKETSMKEIEMLKGDLKRSIDEFREGSTAFLDALDESSGLGENEESCWISDAKETSRCYAPDDDFFEEFRAQQQTQQQCAYEQTNADLYGVEASAPKEGMVVNDDTACFVAGCETFGTLAIMGKDVLLHVIDWQSEEALNASVLVGGFMQSFLYPFDLGLRGDFSGVKLLFGTTTVQEKECLLYVVMLPLEDERAQGLCTAGFNMLTQDEDSGGEGIVYYYYAVCAQDGSNLYF